MYVRGFPKYYVKDGKRRAVYYSVEARDLTALGWVPEETTKKAKEAKPIVEKQEQEQEAPRVEVDIIDETEVDGTSDLELMTKNELLKYALDRGVDLPNNAPKAQILEACKAIK